MTISPESRHSHATVLAVCISETRGVQKTPVDEIAVALEHGVEDDAHAGDWHRQVSLLADESAEIMRAKGVPVGPGGFGENIVTRGIEVKELPLGTRVRVGETALLEVTQLGKTCHTPCAIGRLAGECIMPVEGVFCRVLNAGKIRAGDRIDVVARPAGDAAEPAARRGSNQAGSDSSSPAAFPTAVLVLSDSRSEGRREELVIPACREVLQGTAFKITETQVIPDEEAQLADALRALVARGDIALILTSGGTGLAPRDRTPEATRAVIEREAPGFAELLRLKGLEKTPMAVLTRGIAGTAGHCLIINLPGSPKAVREGLEVLLPILPHALETLLGRASECASVREWRCMMPPHRVDFSSLAWESPMPGVRQKMVQDESRRLRLVEYSSQMEPHWCEKGHFGYILDGRFELEFDDGKTIFEPGDGIFIPDGHAHRHQARVLSDSVTVVFVESV